MYHGGMVEHQRTALAKSPGYNNASIDRARALKTFVSHVYLSDIGESDVEE